MQSRRLKLAIKEAQRQRCRAERAEAQLAAMTDGAAATDRCQCGGITYERAGRRWCVRCGTQEGQCNQAKQSLRRTRTR